MGRSAGIRDYVLEVTVFFSGALVMVYEIIGSRILSPYVGTSTYTWTSLIGVILAALSLGYWIGGKWADRSPSPRILASVLFLAGVLVGATVLLKDVFLSVISAASLPLEIKTLIAAVALFAPASVFLGFVPPYAVKLRVRELGETGRTVGRLYALSTIGSIVGTFAAGFFLLPFAGSVRTLYIISGLLILLSVLLAPFRLLEQKIGLIAIPIVAVLFSETAAYVFSTRFSYLDTDSSYSRIRVFDTTHKKSGRPLRALAIDPYIYQSSMFLDTGEPGSEYHRYFDLISHFTPDLEKALMIGGAGYSYPKMFLEKYPGKKMTVVEIDPAMTEIAREKFGLREDEDLRIVHEDGRVFLNRSQPEQFDAVLIDAFGTMFSIPFQLSTEEAVREMHRVLNGEGVVIVNIGTSIEGNAAKFLGAELATFRKVFAEVRLYQVDPSKSADAVQNVILVAFKTSRRESDGSADERISEMLDTEFDGSRVREMPVLTDDLAPVEYYSSFAQWKLVSGNS